MALGGSRYHDYGVAEPWATECGASAPSAVSVGGATHRFKERRVVSRLTPWSPSPSPKVASATSLSITHYSEGDAELCAACEGGGSEPLTSPTGFTMARWGGRRSRDVPFTISLKGGCRVELRLDVSPPSERRGIV